MRRYFNETWEYWICLIIWLILVGCAPAPRPAPVSKSTISIKDYEDHPPEIDTVLALYGAPPGTVGPSVAWVAGDPACYGMGWLGVPRVEPDGVLFTPCLKGVYYPAALPNIIFVATWPGAVIPQTSLAHETLHWLLWKQGINSADHGGDFYARVQAANEALWDAE